MDASVSTAKSAAPLTSAMDTRSPGTIKRREQEFIAEFNELADWMLQYEYLLYYLEDLDELSEQECTDATKIPACVSNAWMKLSKTPNNTLRIQLTSEALIIKGILGTITALIKDAPLQEIASWAPRFIEETSLQ